MNALFFLIIGANARLFDELHKSQAVQCTADDIKLIMAAGGGDASSSFPGKCADCGSKSWSLFGGFNDSKFDTCLTGELSGLSSNCAQCFATAAHYGFDNCKTKCITSWCSSSCLSCSSGASAAVAACAGSTSLPQPT